MAIEAGSRSVNSAKAPVCPHSIAPTQSLIQWPAGSRLYLEASPDCYRD